MDKMIDAYFYILGLLATVTFSVSGVLAVRSQGVDLFGVLVIGVVTAVGGGTIRDVLLGVPVFWLLDSIYIWCAVAAAALAFALRDVFARAFRLLLYLDALGVALFAALAVQKTLGLGLDGIHAVAMGVITGIGGGIIRDVIAGRPTLIMMRDLYATPILFGIAVQLLLLEWLHVEPLVAVLSGVACIFAFRSLAIHFHWQMPDFLSFQRDSP